MVWNPLRILRCPELNLQKIVNREDNSGQKTRQLSSPAHKEIKEAIIVDAGQYLYSCFVDTTFRSAKQNILNPHPCNDNGEPTSEEVTPTYEYFLEQEDRGLESTIDHCTCD
ncbi:hypothetical protein ACJMK2_018859 [Sinanodonta woodiana]|uniref:Uncharacterized protein n=1 Tax=Sinanodonta woodiana TaxID=1069815 RepID=A0ABD3UIA4_SINWO